MQAGVRERTYKQIEGRKHIHRKKLMRSGVCRRLNDLWMC